MVLFTHRVKISNDDLKTRKHYRKSLLFPDKKQLDEKKIKQLFFVTIGCYDAPDICEKIGSIIILQQSRTIYKNNKGLYRYNGLFIIKEPNGHRFNKYRKKNSKCIETTRIQIYYKNKFEKTFLI